MQDDKREKMCSETDPNNFILNSFEFYKKHRSKNDRDLDRMVTQLIYIYYEMNPNEIRFDNMRKSFVKKYCTSETTLEGVDYLTQHGREELKGLAKMYEYMHSPEIDERFDIFSIKDLHEKLFSLTPYPEFGGNFRRDFAYLKGARTNLCDWRYIFPSLNKLDEDVQHLRAIAPEIKALRNPILLMRYLDLCVELNCKLIKIHPFSDGNGRTIRCFTNKLMEDAGLPSVYVKPEEREEYLSAMRFAMDEEDYRPIQRFYRYKVCDSIVELDINERLRERNNTINLTKKSKQKKLGEAPTAPTDPGNR